MNCEYFEDCFIERGDRCIDLMPTRDYDDVFLSLSLNA